MGCGERRDDIRGVVVVVVVVVVVIVNGCMSYVGGWIIPSVSFSQID